MKTLLILSFVMGMICVLLGIFLKKYPQYMSGYDKDNPPSAEQMTRLKYGFITAGILTVMGILFSFIFFESLPLMAAFLFTPIFLAAVYSVVLLKPKGWKIIASFITAILVGVFVLIGYSIQEPEVSVEGSSLKISGFYGETIPLDKIRAVSMMDSMPQIGFKTNGFGLGEVRKGYFKIAGMGTVKLILTTETKPLVRIDLDGNVLIFNTDDSTKTKRIYQTIRQAVEEKDISR